MPSEANRFEVAGISTIRVISIFSRRTMSAGVPPTVGFYAKLAVLQSVIQAGHMVLAVFVVLFALIGAWVLGDALRANGWRFPGI